jgi:CRP/FNR family cyclic AMP-dependent transcriptional regulator
MRPGGQELRDQARGLGDPGEAVSLFGVLPELLDAVPAGQRQLAERLLVAPALTARDEHLAEAIAEALPGAFDFLIVEGIVLKETSLRSRAALEILGPGDVLAPPLSASRQLESRATSRYLAHGPATLAVLGHRFRQAVKRWPELSDVLHDRLARQTHHASMHMAMLHMRHVEDRIKALFADLAERFGHVTPEGVLIELSLTHELIGRLVASRRPTVTLALVKLESDGLLRRLDNDGWMVPLSAVSP